MSSDRYGRKPTRVFYAASGPGDVIEAYHYWKKGERHPNVTSLTFSGQIQDFCKKLGVEAYILSSNSRKAIEYDPPFTIEHRPRPISGAGGMKYHLSQIIHGLGLVRTARRFKADLALIDSGCTHYFVLPLFSLFGIRVIPILHNALWPKGHPPTRPITRLIMKLDTILFWRRIPKAAICMSPECERQVLSLLRKPPAGRLTYLALAQFDRDRFEGIPQPQGYDEIPFQIIICRKSRGRKGGFRYSGDGKADRAAVAGACSMGTVRGWACA